MSHDYLLLHFYDDRDGTGRLQASVRADGFSGEGEAYFESAEIEEFAASIASFPLPTEPVCIAGGLWRGTDRHELAEEHLALKVYPIGSRGYIGVRVRVASELRSGARADFTEDDAGRSRHNV